MNLKETLNNALPRFLRRCDAKSTRVAYQREISRFLAWMPEETNDELLFDYRDHLRQRNLGSTTIRWRTTVVRSFLLFAKRRGLMDVDLVSDFKPPKGKSGFAPRVLTEGELTRLIGVADRRTAQGRRDAAVLVCLGVGGLRAGEICALNAEDVTVNPHAVVLQVNGKGDKVRTVILPGDWADLFQGYLRMWPKSRKTVNPFFWCGQVNHRRITPAAIRYLLNNAAEIVGLTGLHPHVLRHTAATLEIKKGASLPVIQAQMGHSSVLTTMKYLHL